MDFESRELLDGRLLLGGRLTGVLTHPDHVPPKAMVRCGLVGEGFFEVVEDQLVRDTVGAVDGISAKVLATVAADFDINFPSANDH